MIKDVTDLEVYNESQRLLPGLYELLRGLPINRPIYGYLGMKPYNAPKTAGYRGGALVGHIRFRLL